MSTKRLGKDTKEISLYLNENIIEEIDNLCEKKGLKSRSILIQKTVADILAEPLNIEELEDFKFITKEEYSFLLDALNNNKSVLICGMTGSGKTTLMRALIDNIDERFLYIDNRLELDLKEKAIISEYVISEQSIQLVIDALRHKPTMIVIGELRNNDELDKIKDIPIIATTHCNKNKFNNLLEHKNTNKFDYIVYIDKNEENIREVQFIYDINNRKEVDVYG